MINQDLSENLSHQYLYQNSKELTDRRPKKYRLLHLPIILRTRNPITEKNDRSHDVQKTSKSFKLRIHSTVSTVTSFTKQYRFLWVCWLLGWQGIVIKCTARRHLFPYGGLLIKATGSWDVFSILLRHWRDKFAETLPSVTNALE